MGLGAYENYTSKGARPFSYTLGALSNGIKDRCSILLTERNLHHPQLPRSPRDTLAYTPGGFFHQVQIFVAAWRLLLWPDGLM